MRGTVEATVDRPAQEAQGVEPTELFRSQYFSSGMVLESKKHVSKDGEGLRPPKHDGNGIDESEEVAHSKSEIHTSFCRKRVDIFQYLCGASVVVRFPAFSKNTTVKISFLGGQSNGELIKRYYVSVTGAEYAPKML